ncbi:hypothetical protein SDC9_150670 [bioreactor metagenome]|uniref:Uncharacterized protein n=1 Tax=bioreactor metagenome TaxID=1076179 RepID=A0A645EQ10_9ZZZZ
MILRHQPQQSRAGLHRHDLIAQPHRTAPGQGVLPDRQLPRTPVQTMPAVAVIGHLLMAAIDQHGMEPLGAFGKERHETVESAKIHIFSHPFPAVLS